MNGIAFWISPRGKVIPVVTSHIATVIEAPTTFKTAASKIEAVFAKHDEPIGHEGYSREEILVDLLKRRWIRVREHVNSHWSIQFHTASPRTKAHIRAWARAALRRGIVRDRYAQVRLVGLGDGYGCDVEFHELANSTDLEVRGNGKRRLRWAADPGGTR